MSTTLAPPELSPARRGHPRRWLILFVILAAECMDLVDGTVVTIAAPAIRTDLHAGTTALQWIVGGYALAFAVGLITGGRLGDMAGRRRMFLLGSAGFTAASVLCGLAPSTGALIAARLVQGACGALMIPQGFGIIRDVFPEDERAKAFGAFGPVMGLAAVGAPVVGGALVTGDVFGWDWRTVFLINLPIGLAAFAGAVRVLPESRLPVAPRLDVTGALLVSAAAGLLMYPLIQGRDLGWPAWAFALMAGSVALLGAFAVHVRRRVRRGGDPLVMPSLFARAGFSGGLLVGVVFFGAMLGSVFALTLFLQVGHGFTAIRAGVALIPFCLGTAVGAGVGGGALAPRFGRAVVQAGAVAMGAGALWLASAVGGSVTAWHLTGPLALMGLGMGLVVAPFFAIVLAAVADDEVGAASGTLNAVQQFAGAAGVAGLGTLFFSAVAHHGFETGMHRVLWIQAALMAVVVALTFLLPAHAREDALH